MHPYIVIFGQKIQTYYLCAAGAGLLGAALSAAALKRNRQGAWAYILPLLVIGSALIGARVLNFLIYPGAYTHGFHLWTFSYRKLSLMGGLVAGTAVTVLYCCFRKARLPLIADALTLPAAAGIMLLKLGCFLNGCCFGKPTDGPFGMIFPANKSGYGFINSLQLVKAKSPVVHPTQLYEIAGALGAITAAIVLPRVLKMKEGSRAAIFAALFSAARWIVLPLRELPYGRNVVTIFYPCFYAALICCAAGFLMKHGFSWKQKQTGQHPQHETRQI